MLTSRKFLSSVFGLDFIPTLIREYSRQSEYPTVLFRCVFISEKCENFRKGKFDQISGDDLSTPPQRMIVKIIIRREHAEVLNKNGEYIWVPYVPGGVNIPCDRDFKDLDICLRLVWDVKKNVMESGYLCGGAVVNGEEDLHPRFLFGKKVDDFEGTKDKQSSTTDM